MTLKLQDLKTAIFNAMREKDSIKKDVLSVVVGNIENKGELKSDKADENKVILTEIVSFVKKLEAAKKDFEQREDEKSKLFLEKTQKEIEVLATYLPKQLTKEELQQIIENALATQGFKNKNQVLGYLNKNYQGQFSNDVAKEIVNGF